MTIDAGGREDAKPGGLKRHATAPGKAGEDYRPPPETTDAVDAFIRSGGVASEKMLESALTVATNVPKQGGLVSHGSVESVDRTVYDHAGYAGKESQEASPLQRLATYDPYLGQTSKPPEEEEEETPLESAEQEIAGPGIEAPWLWDPALAWSGMMPGMMPPGITPPWPGMMSPEMGMPDPAMYAMWYHQAVWQQAWATQNMMGMPPNVPPYPAPAYPALGAELVEEETIDLPSNVWKLAKTSVGSRRVQDALETALDDAERLKIAEEMKTHVREAYRCPHANHVIQKCITTMPPDYTGFIITELNEGPGSAVKIARHKFGCRVLQRLLEHPSPQVHWIVEELLLEAVELSKHAYANFVLQHVLEHASDEQKTRLVTLLTLHVATVAEEGNGSAVLHQAMEHSNDEAKVELSHALISQPELLAAMACTRHGHLTAEKALEVAGEAQRNQALLELMAYEDKLKTSRYGRVLFRYLEEKRAQREEQDPGLRTSC